MTDNILWHDYSVSFAERQKQKKHKSCVLWYTGLSGSGKSTIANAVDRMLFNIGCSTFVLDGDNIRHGLNKDLDFSEQSRVENIRRISEVSKLFVESGCIVSTAFISPFQVDREIARNLIGDSFIEIFVNTPLEICELRDPKGLYRKARAGIIKDFTGVDAIYEAPVSPHIIVEASSNSVEDSAVMIVDYLKNIEIIK